MGQFSKLAPSASSPRALPANAANVILRAPLPSVLITGFFWAWLLVWYTNAADRAWPIADPSFFLVVRLPVIASCMLGTFVIAWLLATGRVLGTKATVLSGAASMTGGQVVLMIASTLDSAAQRPWLGVGSFIAFAGSAALLPMWNADFNYGDVTRRGATILASSLIGVGLFLLISAFSAEWAIAITLALPVLSAGVIVVSCNVAPALVTAPVCPTTAAADLGNVAASIGLGLLSGITLGFDLLEYAPTAPAPNTRAVYVFAGVVSLAFAAWLLRTLRSVDRARPVLPLLPMVVIGLLILPFSGGGIRTLTQLAVGSAVLCWAMVLALGPTDNVYRVTVGTKCLEVREQVINMAIGTNGAVIGYLLGLLLDTNSGALRLLVVILAYAVALWTAVLVSFRVSRSQESQLTSLGKQDACRSIAFDYGLTERELEVLWLLAEGRNLPYVQKALSIAHGTATTHVTHIYQKLGIHDRQELLDLISQWNQQNSTPPRVSH